jgi:Tfp pilus assembly protein PilO
MANARKKPSNLSDTARAAVARLAFAPLWERVLALAAAFSIVALVAYYMALAPARDAGERAAALMKVEEATLLRTVEFIDGLRSLPARYRASLSEINALKSALPDSAHIPALISQIANTGQACGVDFVEFSPGAPVEKKNYSVYPVTVSGTASWRRLVCFIDGASQLRGDVTVTNWNISAPKSGYVLNFSAVVETFAKPKPKIPVRR